MARRSVFIPKIDYILTEIMGNKPFQYIYGVEWNKYKDNYTSLYRMTSGIALLPFVINFIPYT